MLFGTKKNYDQNACDAFKNGMHIDCTFIDSSEKGSMIAFGTENTIPEAFICEQRKALAATALQTNTEEKKIMQKQNAMPYCF